MRIAVTLLALVFTIQSQAQETNRSLEEIKIIRNNPYTPVKNQANTGTCWCFSTTSMIESACLHEGQQALDLSEMFTVRNIYREKAENYIHRQGFTRFDEGGLGHDVLHAIAAYGVVPEDAYSGLKEGQAWHDHAEMVGQLRAYLDSILKLSRPIPTNWEDGFNAIMDKYLGTVPANFTYKGRSYTAKTFAKEVVKFNADDYVSLTSFTHHPFYSSFIIEVPDNVSNGAYYNIPLKELIDIAKTAVEKGYTVLWDADVSNHGFMVGKGYALRPLADSLTRGALINPDVEEKDYSQEERQQLFDELVTEDDHLMHITGIGKTGKGKEFFIVKNSYGSQSGPFDGFIKVSIPYFAINTITIIVPKAALEKSLSGKLAVK
ncbi:C1 family peptidase [Chitinophaga pinensis]|uniref:Aminopeptidase n=1 Tax=Chitinophaga pinensis (strain ATCC 43595 / DSM 2588 / LMG 13176 / NBRC 15968 / NCIMB 11800 / UQM 2034) TaxID=485918 RepID=A0A979GAB1_CHIPD|nr:C1 family peptidase [Chitinophaga pinensis]ACU63612.1 peptidase C1B bleomycin hydrolase [Chitinophaga pinensis DSM 2588]